MRSTSHGFVLLLLGALATAVNAADIKVDGAWARALPPVVKVGAAYLEVHNTGSKDASLISASSDIAETVELHEHTMSDGMMRMRKMERIIIPPGATMTFEPGGKHLMLISLKRPLEAGKQFGLTLTFEGIGEQKLKVPILKE